MKRLFSFPPLFFSWKNKINRKELKKYIKKNIPLREKNRDHVMLRNVQALPPLAPKRHVGRLVGNEEKVEKEW